MRKIPISYGLLTFLEELEYSEAALLADDDAQVLAAAFTTAIAGWDPQFQKERVAHRGVIQSEARVAVRNEQLDANTMKFAKAARGLAPELIGKIFIGTPGHFIRTNLRDQATRTLTVFTVELAKLDPSHPLAFFGPTLGKLAQAAIDALDSRGKAKGANATTGNDVDEWKEGINSLRLTTWTELLKIADALGYPRSWAESFFRHTDDGADKPEEPAAAPAAAAAAPAVKP